MCKIWERLVQPFYRDDDYNRDYNFINIDWWTRNSQTIWYVFLINMVNQWSVVIWTSVFFLFLNVCNISLIQTWLYALNIMPYSFIALTLKKSMELEITKNDFHKAKKLKQTNRFEFKKIPVQRLKRFPWVLRWGEKGFSRWDNGYGNTHLILISF